MAATVTSNWTVTALFALTANGPLHVSTSPAMTGSAVVAPVVVPGTYAKPPGSVSVIDSRLALSAFGLLMAMV